MRDGIRGLPRHSRTARPRGPHKESETKEKDEEMLHNDVAVKSFPAPTRPPTVLDDFIRLTRSSLVFVEIAPLLPERPEALEKKEETKIKRSGGKRTPRLQIGLFVRIVKSVPIDGVYRIDSNSFFVRSCPLCVCSTQNWSRFI